jgi:inhibitor of cysteine peptidase
MTQTTDVLMNEGDSGRTLDLTVGQALSLELSDPGPTGYRWKVESLDESVLSPEGTRTQPSAAVGGTGKATLTFQAKAPGTTRLRLKLWREWLGDASVIRRFDALLHIR